MSVRDIEVRLASVEDTLLSRLGYREYTVRVGNTTLEIAPEVIQKSLKAYSDDQLRKFIQSLGSRGNPIAYFEVAVSREIGEPLVRSMDYWYLSRDGYQATCLPCDIQVDDSRYLLVLGVIKQTQT